MSRLIEILRAKENENPMHCRQSIQGLGAEDLEITDEVFNVLAREIAPLKTLPEGEFYRFREILGLAEPILQQASLTEIPQERRESVRRLLFGSVLEQCGLDRTEFYADIQRAYNAYCARVESLKDLQRRLAPEFNIYSQLYGWNLTDHPISNLIKAKEKGEL